MNRRIALMLTVSALLLNAPTLADPVERGLVQASQESKTQGSVYVCPMHPEVTSKSPGTCPKCGMTLRASGDEDIPESRGPESKGKDGEVELQIPDTTVYDQDGRSLHFYADLVKGKTVIVNFIFTTCTTICPPLTATMRKVQQSLGERSGGGIQLISISVDPVTDVPQRLKTFAKQFSAGEGWAFITGGKQEIDSLLKALGAYSANKLDHTPMFLIGNDAAGYWTRIYGLSSAQAIAKLATEISDKRASGR